MDLGLADRVFLVTAASAGLVRATAQQLVAEGARVVLVARRAELLDEAVSRLGRNRAAALAADLVDAGTAETACALALERFGSAALWHGTAQPATCASRGCCRPR